MPKHKKRGPRPYEVGACPDYPCTRCHASVPLYAMLPGWRLWDGPLCATCFAELARQEQEQKQAQAQEQDQDQAQAASKTKAKAKSKRRE